MRVCRSEMWAWLTPGPSCEANSCTSQPFSVNNQPALCPELIKYYANETLNKDLTQIFYYESLNQKICPFSQKVCFCHRIKELPKCWFIRFAWLSLSLDEKVWKWRCPNPICDVYPFPVCSPRSALARARDIFWHWHLSLTISVDMQPQLAYHPIVSSLKRIITWLCYGLGMIADSRASLYSVLNEPNHIQSFTMNVIEMDEVVKCWALSPVSN